MGLDLFFKDDIYHILVALHQAMLSTGVDGDYRRGYEAALTATALAFGLDPRRDLPLLPETRGGGDE